MRFSPWCKSEVRRLPRTVQEHLRVKYILRLDYVDSLRCFQYKGLVNGEHATCILVFNPDQARENRLLIKSSSDLEQHPEMLLFEGHIDSQGRIAVADRRMPLRQPAAS